MRRYSLIFPVFAALILSFFLGACVTGSAGGSRRGSPDIARRTMKPVVAVADFEDLSGFSGDWNLSHGMARLVSDGLIESETVLVADQKETDSTVKELLKKGQDLLQGKKGDGTLQPRNARFAVQGTITDFSENGSKARVALTLRVSDVVMNELVGTIKVDGSSSSNKKEEKGRVVFGGDAFFRTPLGRASQAAVSRAVKNILKSLPPVYWEPRIAEAGPDSVVINGGANVRLRLGDVFLVREAGREITDPVTGNVIEITEGKVVGKIQVRQVNPASAHAVLLEGSAQRGNTLATAR